MIDYETTRLRRQWSPEEALHRRAIAARRQCKLAALLGLDTAAAEAEAADCKRAERAGIARLQRAKEAPARTEEAQEIAPASTRLFHQARRGGVLPRFLITRRDSGSSGLRARVVVVENAEDETS
jgi:hypothetical protein